MAPEPITVVPADALYWTAMFFTVVGALLTRWALRRDRRARIKRQRDALYRRRKEERRFAELTARYVSEMRAAVQEQVQGRTGRKVRVLSPAALLIQAESIPTSVSRS